MPRRRPHHRLHRRVGTERAAHPGQDLGAEGPDPGAAVQLQLEATVADRRGDDRQLLLSLLPRLDQGAAVGRILKALGRQIKGKLLIVWDGLPAHRSRLVRSYVESLDGRIVLERLPAYAPELNPVEYLFGYAKQRELANLCLRVIDDVRRFASGRLKAMQRRPRLIAAFWKQAELPL